MTTHKRERRRLDGVLLLDKPYGMSSNVALQKVRRLFNAEKAGHTGTLDPLATGLLPLCFGEATKFSGDLLNADKEYEARLQLGVTTRTGDREGEILTRHPVLVDAAQIESQLQAFRGRITQLPPMHSALKSGGQALYKLARQGKEVERTARIVEIHRLEQLELNGDMLLLRVRCSKGTYIRTLAEDIGQALGCGAHLADLRRTGAGSLTVADTTTLDQLAQCTDEARDALLAPVDSLLASLPRITLSSPDANCFLHGNPITTVAAADQYRIYHGNDFIGLGKVDAGWLKPKRLLRYPAL